MDKPEKSLTATTKSEIVASFLNIIEKRIDHWIDRISFYKDPAYLTEGQVLHELEVIKSQLREARRIIAS